MKAKQVNEWETEPNRTQFEHAGFTCITRRADRLLHWCGYVGVPPGHPWHGKSWNDDLPVSVHGGITYGEKCDGDPVGGVCHVAADGTPDDVWWLGFDCAHSGDYSPGIRAGALHSRDPFASFYMGDDGQGDVYRNLAYVQAECRSLAEQAARARPSEGG